MRPEPIRGVLFDLDDTLLDHSAAAASAIRRLVRDVTGRADDDAGAVDRWRALERQHFAR